MPNDTEKPARGSKALRRLEQQVGPRTAMRELSNLHVCKNHHRQKPGEPFPSGYLSAFGARARGFDLMVTGLMAHVDEPYLIEEVDFKGRANYVELVEEWKRTPLD